MGIFSEPVVFVDIETSGGRVSDSKITEIAAVRVENGQETGRFISLLNPGSPLPYWITKLTGIKDSDLVDAPSFSTIAQELYSFMEGAVFIAHNVRFDYSFIKQAFAEEGMPFNPKLLCTVRLSRALYPEASGHSLAKLIDRHGIKVSARHRALDDTLATIEFVNIAFREKGELAFNQAIKAQSKHQTLPPNLSPKVLDKSPVKHGVYIYKDSAGQPLYIGKSINVRGRLMSHFSDDIRSNKEMKMSQKVHDIEIIQTDSELEALLLESSLVKKMLPVFNRQLRKQSELTIIKRTVDPSGYYRLSIGTSDNFSDLAMDEIYAVHRTVGQAKLSLINQIRTFSLCQKLSGIEKGSGPCFHYQLHKCSGACIGKEPANEYNQRLDTAMSHSRLLSWPYPGAIKIPISKNQQLIINNWRVEAKITKTSNGPKLEPVSHDFDYDSYRIVSNFLNKNMAEQPEYLDGVVSATA